MKRLQLCMLAQCLLLSCASLGGQVSTAKLKFDGAVTDDGLAVMPTPSVATDETKAQSCGSSSPTAKLDIYGGDTSNPAPGGATGYFRLEKWDGRWWFVTPKGNAFVALGVSLVHSGNLGVDRNGLGYSDYAQEKYAKGQGPGDGFKDWRSRWAYYARERLRSWGFTFVSTFSHPPVIPDYSDPANPEGVVPTGTLPDNRMPHAITRRTGGDAMRFGNVKNIYGPVFSKFYNAYFPDVFDPAFAAFMDGYAQEGDWGSSPWVLFVFMDQTDEMRGVDSGHPHLGFVAAAANFEMASDPRGFGGAKTYEDATLYTKVAVCDFLKARYDTVAVLNEAWGTSYTTFGSDGGWGTGSGCLDENGAHLGNWNGADPQPGTTMRADLDDFAAEIIRRWFQPVYTAFKKHKPNHVLATNNMNVPQGYVVRGLKSADGKRVYADLMIANETSGTAYEQLRRPFFSALPFVTAAVDTPLGYAGKVDAVEFDESAENPNQWKVVVTCNSCDFWWAANPNYKLAHWVWTQFSSLPAKIVRGSTVSDQFYRTGKAEWLAPNRFAVMQSSYFNGTYAELKEAIQPGDTFKRWVTFHRDHPDTQVQRGTAYESTVTRLLNTQAPSGEFFYVGTNHWSWSDTSWVGYFEAYNFGLVTLRDNAYDGVEAIRASGTLVPGQASNGFTVGGEEKDYGDFLSAVRRTNRSVRGIPQCR